VSSVVTGRFCAAYAIRARPQSCLTRWARRLFLSVVVGVASSGETKCSSVENMGCLRSRPLYGYSPAIRRFPSIGECTTRYCARFSLGRHCSHARVHEI